MRVAVRCIAWLGLILTSWGGSTKVAMERDELTIQVVEFCCPALYVVRGHQLSLGLNPLVSRSVDQVEHLRLSRLVAPQTVCNMIPLGP